MKKRTKKLTSLSYAHYVVLVMLFVGLGGYVTEKLFLNNNSGLVLSTGSGSDGDGEDGGDDNDSGDDHEEDSNDSEAEKEDEPEDNNNDDDHSNSGSSNTSTKTTTSTQTPTKTRTTITNSDGTVTEIRREIENGKVKIKSVTRDANGFKIEEKESESENGKEESKVKTFSSGKKLSEVELKTEDGKKLELKVKEGEESSRVRFNVEKNELEIKSEDESLAEDTAPESEDEPESESSLKIKAVGNNFVLTRNGTFVNSHFPMVVDTTTGQVSVSTPNGLVELKAMPDTIVQKALANVPTVSDVSIDTNTTTPVIYKVSGQKSEKLLGVFTLSIPSSVVYDATTGDFIKSEQSFITRILDLFSF